MLQNTQLRNLGNLLDKMDNQRTLVDICHNNHQLQLVSIHDILFLYIPLGRSIHLCYHIPKQSSPQDYICSLKNENKIDFFKNLLMGKP